MVVTGLLKRWGVSLSAPQFFLLSGRSHRTYKKPTHDMTAVLYSSSSLPSSSPLKWKGREGLLTGLPWRRDKAKLLHETENVRVCPDFGYFAISKAVGVGLCSTRVYRFSPREQ
jgi:hypothetical protein